MAPKGGPRVAGPGKRMGRPRTGRTTVQLGFNGHEAERAPVDNYAKQHGLSRSQVIRMCVRRFFGLKPYLDTKAKRS